MPNTPLQEALAAHPADRQPLALANYRGAETASSFADPKSELTSIMNTCAVYDLGFRAHLSLTGNDRSRWLNGMVTNNIRDLAAGQGLYAFLLNPQGRILGDMFVFNEGDKLLVETDRSQVEKIVATFDHYIIMDDVEVRNLSDNLTALGIAGPNSRAVLTAAGIQLPDLQPLQAQTLQCDCDCGCVECIVVRGEGPNYESYEIWLAPNYVYPTWRALLNAGAVPAGAEALEMHRIFSGIPLYGKDIRERDLPQETEQAHALSFNKGCYVGQEIVERIRSRGNVHRKFTAFVAAGGEIIAPGTKVVSDGKEVGEITSSAVVPLSGGDQVIALGYLRRELSAPGREIIIGNARASVARSPIDSPALQNATDVLMHKVV
jgi:folate-binding protein YgfZ